MTPKRYRPRPCHRPGCPNPKRPGRSYHYCSDDCARAVHLQTKRAASAQWRDGHPTELRAQHLWTRYRLTVEAFDDFLAAQGGRCALCDAPEPGGSGTWHIDHDHACCPGRRSCGRCVRGALCSSCNRRLGVLENQDWITRARAYLDRHPATTT